MKAANERGYSERHTIMNTRYDPDYEPAHASSQTSHALDEMQLYGHRPFEDEPDPRPLPDGDAVAGAVADIFDAFVATFTDTRMEPDLEELLWSATNLFHRASERVERELDKNEQAQKISQREQDGSEVMSVELERLLAEGGTLIERRNTFELMRDQAALQFKQHTGSLWKPHNGSMVNRRALTAAVIDSHDFVAARRRIDGQVLVPPGPKVIITGGADIVGTYMLVYDILDKVLAANPTMVLLHGGTPKGVENVASCWARNKNVPQVVFKPDWAKHGKAAPFKRNDQMLEALPIGVLSFPGNGINENLVDKARKLGIKVLRLGFKTDGA